MLTIVTPAAFVIVTTEPEESVAVVLTPAELVIVITAPAVRLDAGALIGPGPRGTEGAALACTVLAINTVVVPDSLGAGDPGLIELAGRAACELTGVVVDEGGCTTIVVGTMLLLLLGGTELGATFEDVLGGTVTVVVTSVTVVTGGTDELLPESCRLASDSMLVANGASSWCIASTAVWSSLNTPCLNFLGE